MSWTMLLVNYSDSGLLIDECSLFEETLRWSLVFWSAMIMVNYRLVSISIERL